MAKIFERRTWFLRLETTRTNNATILLSLFWSLTSKKFPAKSIHTVKSDNKYVELERVYYSGDIYIHKYFSCGSFVTRLNSYFLDSWRRESAFIFYTVYWKIVKFLTILWIQIIDRNFKFWFMFGLQVNARATV